MCTDGCIENESRQTYVTLFSDSQIYASMYTQQKGRVMHADHVGVRQPRRAVKYFCTWPCLNIYVAKDTHIRKPDKLYERHLSCTSAYPLAAEVTELNIAAEAELMQLKQWALPR